MQKKLCGHCERVADFSLCFLVSTLNKKPRRQKTTEVLNLCAGCLQRFCGGLELIGPPRLAETLRTVYTTYTSGSMRHSDLPFVPTAQPILDQ